MYEIPEGRRTTKGKSIVNFLNLGQTENVTSVLAIPKSKKGEKLLLLMITQNGIIKKVEVGHFSDVRRSGIIALRLKKGDALRWVKLATKNDHIILVTQKGQAIRFKESDVRPMGRTAAGVRAMRFSKSDALVGADVINSGDKNTSLLVVSDRGFGKKTLLKNYRLQRRGGTGIKTMKITAKTGPLVSARVVKPEDEELIAVSKKGLVIRTALLQVPELGRQTQGVRLMKLDDKDAIASITLF